MGNWWQTTGFNREGGLRSERGAQNDWQIRGERGKTGFDKIVWIALLAVLMLAGCSESQPVADQVVARVGEAYLSRETVLQLMPENLSKAEREFFIKRIIEQWVDNQVLAQAARKNGLELSPEDRWHLDKMANEMLGNKYLKTKVGKDFVITDREVEDYYETHQEQFTRDKDEVHLIHLYLDKPDNTIAKEIRATKDLLEVIKTNYLDLQITPAVEPNGDLGYVPVEQLRPAFQKAIQGTKTGLVYGPIRTSQGIHYLQVIDRKPAGSVRSISLVRNEIETFLRIARREKRIDEMVESMRKEFKAETFYENIL